MTVLVSWKRCNKGVLALNIQERRGSSSPSWVCRHRNVGPVKEQSLVIV